VIPKVRALLEESQPRSDGEENDMTDSQGSRPNDKQVNLQNTAEQWVSRQASSAKADATSAGSPAKGSSKPFSDPEKAREAAQRSAEVRRERKIQRETAVEEARLTSRQRLALALSRKLTTADYEAMVRALLEASKQGDAKAVHALARLHDQAFGQPQLEPRADEDEDEWERMSPAQRAALRAALDQRLEELQAQAELPAVEHPLGGVGQSRSDSPPPQPLD
jgi:hypothetical protein